MPSVFNKAKQSNMSISLENHLKHPCSESHTFDMVIPKVDPSIHSIQNPNLIGRPCDCGKLLYNEKLCGCGVQQWEIEYLPNPNY